MEVIHQHDAKAELREELEFVGPPRLVKNWQLTV